MNPTKLLVLDQDQICTIVDKAVDATLKEKLIIDQVMTREETAEFLQIDPVTLDTFVKDGFIRSVKMRRTRRFLKSMVIEDLKKFAI